MLPLVHLSKSFAPDSTAIAAVSTAQMTIFQGIVLGLVQGLTEFLPISSTAHLKVVPIVLGWGDPGVAFTAVIQLGSIAAVLWYFWGDLTQVLTGAFKAIQKSDYQSQEFRMAVGIALGTIPIVFCGVLVKLFIPDFDNSPLRSTGAIAGVSIVMGLLMGISEKATKRQREFGDLGAMDGVVMGLAQALAIIPGVSRSGSTLTAGMFMGLERPTAARFSFLLGIPAITLAGLVELLGLLKDGLGETGLTPLIAGVISAAVFSYAAIAWMLEYLKKHGIWIFVWYRALFGVAIFIAMAGGWLQ
ncbi:MAG: undecaprenyl-diphosphate phosphatase [Leptolyngbyaceae cyanobacterium MO_188.B28]|nr:undecaprenyl-diphosphate phosphatase [Leptolyngbyaceae cyanobacterium MO_188.B28]